MTQYVIISKDGLEAETTLEAAQDVWVPVMGWEIISEPTTYLTRDPFPPETASSTESSTAGDEAPAEDADGMRAPGESNQEPEGAPDEAV